MRDYETVIGLEVHAQLLTNAKIFCSCSAAFGLNPNTNTCPVCLGMPGVLPVLNGKIVDFGIRLGLALGCTIEKRNVFARKNYFYPDLPKGYQITQYENPLCTDGRLDIEVNGATKRIGIRRIHMEEDAGKSVHDESEPYSSIDFNRAGVPLLEIVTEPDLSSTQEAVSYLRELRRILMYLDICDGSMEEGSLRCDANLSVKEKGSGRLGTRTELKNMNSFKNVQKALEYEVERQTRLIESGSAVEQETLLWNALLGKTQSMRSKEESHDYRYFPDPDLIPVIVDDAWVERIADTLPELPAAKRRRFIEQYGLPAYDADQLTQTRALADYFEQCVSLYGTPKEVSNWIMTEVIRVLNEKNRDITELPVTPPMLVELLGLLKKGTVSGLMAKEVFTEMADTGRNAPAIIKSSGLEQVSDEDALAVLIKDVMAAHPKETAQYRAGKTQLLGFFVGEVMKASKGKANPKVAGNMIKEMLET
ncbi:MAG TPA: Asp-tRNA(Asn)/Glu-tRNA(Gln) amidotransferase subunit GatB [Desulfomonilia bacterium]|nr:Asp-tRNA(Asn)/Glu-tRNA(Gln) amidotransferase subunit GatB [Desulfomonilia bacterium]